MHSILVQEVNTDDGATPAADQLSSYLTSLLSDPLAALPTLDSIVSLSTYLRCHPRSAFKSSLDNSDKWLSVPWSLLASGAVRTSKPFAALLFLELAAQYDHLFSPDPAVRDTKKDETAQTLLYDVYASIDEPDGYYGHESADVREALARRYRHEGRWDAALGTYGAEFENPSDQLRSGVSSKVTAGVVQSLAYSGFNRLAQSLLQPARADGQLSEDDVPTGLGYDLAWRTDTWDIPIERRALGTSSVAVFDALRAVNSARDHSGLEARVDAYLVQETHKLSVVNLDSPTPDAGVLAAILSLREVRKWAQLDLGESLDAGFAIQLPQLVPCFR